MSVSDWNVHLLPPIRREVWWDNRGMLKGRTITVKLCFCFVLDSQCNSLLQGPKKLHCSQIVQENAAKSDEGKRREKGRCSTPWERLSLSPSSPCPLNPSLQLTTHVRLFFFNGFFHPAPEFLPTPKNLILEPPPQCGVHATPQLTSPYCLRSPLLGTGHQSLMVVHSGT